MKKILISTIIILILILTGITIINGLEVGNFKILGIKEIKNKNEQLDNKIQEATKLASTDYQRNLDELDKTAKEFQKTKTNYEDMVNVSTDSEVQAANQYGVYEIGMLWINLGNHAKSEGVTMDVSAQDLTRIDTDIATETEKRYTCNLHFTAVGTYAGIASFIEDIEDDSKLGFRIEDFRMSPSSEGTNILQATFTCKDIIIRGVVNNSAVNAQNDIDNIENNTTENNTTENNTTENNETANETTQK